MGLSYISHRGYLYDDGGNTTQYIYIYPFLQCHYKRPGSDYIDNTCQTRSGHYFARPAKPSTDDETATGQANTTMADTVPTTKPDSAELMPQPTDPMATKGFSIFITITVAPEDVDTFMGHFRVMFAEMTRNPACLLFEVYRHRFHGGEGVVSWVEDWYVFSAPSLSSPSSS